MTRPTVLISGAGIAGPAAAFWLRRYGWDITVIERAADMRRGGQNVDIRGAGREVLALMGLEQAVLDRNTGERGTRFVDASGAVVAEFGVSGDAGPTAELEILRGDLAELLHDQTRDEVDYRFGTTIADVRTLEDGVEVTFADGTAERYDLLIVAEGIRSATRGRTFDDADALHRLGAYMAWLTIPREATDVDYWVWYNAPGRRVATLRPDNHGTIRATVSFMSDLVAAESWPAAEQRDLLRTTFADAGWETDRIIGAADDADLYLEAIAQVRLPSWVSGRTVLLGDAAWTASPVAGYGTSLGLIGAYILAGELAAATDLDAGLRSYQELMRPHAEQGQSLPPGTPGLAHPRTAAGITAFHLGLRAAASTPGQKVASVLGGASRQRNAPVLPRYVPVPV